MNQLIVRSYNAIAKIALNEPNDKAANSPKSRKSVLSPKHISHRTQSHALRTQSHALQKKPCIRPERTSFDDVLFEGEYIVQPDPPASD